MYVVVGFSETTADFRHAAQKMIIHQSSMVHSSSSTRKLGFTVRCTLLSREAKASRWPSAFNTARQTVLCKTAESFMWLSLRPTFLPPRVWPARVLRDKGSQKKGLAEEMQFFSGHVQKCSFSLDTFRISTPALSDFLLNARSTLLKLPINAEASRALLQARQR